MKAPNKGCKPPLYLYSEDFHHNKKPKMPLYTRGSLHVRVCQPSMHAIETLPEQIYMAPAILLNHDCTITDQPRHEPCQCGVVLRHPKGQWKLPQHLDTSSVHVTVHALLVATSTVNVNKYSRISNGVFTHSPIGS